MKLLQTFIIILFLNVSYLSAKDGKTPNIIFILTDDQRYDEIGAVGNFPWLVTPNLDKLLKEGIYFKNAFVTTSLCGPSRASFLTGTYANHHGVVVNEYVDYDKIFQHLLHYLKMQDTTQHILENGIKLCIIAQGLDSTNGWYFGDKANIMEMHF